MKVSEIAVMPTTLRFDPNEPFSPNGYHESVLRAYNILAKVKELLRLGVPNIVILEMIELMEPYEKWISQGDLESAT